jgi:type VI secretion system protein ImpM
MSGQALGLPDETTVIDAQSAAAPGWYGKLAMLGDFASRRLSSEFITRCDEWLSNGISASRTQLGARWLDAYLTGPIWRFALAPGVIDTQWWFGTLMPSVDAVGRYFPLVVADARSAAPLSIDAFDKLEAWYAHVAAAALETLSAGANLDAYEAALERTPLLADTAPDIAPASTLLASRDRHTYAGAAALRRWASLLSIHEPLRRYAGHSFWSPLQDAAAPASLSVSPGLPSPDEFALMLEGRW